MDIDPLCGIGGCYNSWLIHLNCMANYKSSSTTPLHLFLISLLLFLFLFLAPRAGPVLAQPQTLASTSSSSTTSVTVSGSRPLQKRKPAAREFMVDEHEVPSGPNPISN